MSASRVSLVTGGASRPSIGSPEWSLFDYTNEDFPLDLFPLLLVPQIRHAALPSILSWGLPEEIITILDSLESSDSFSSLQ